MPHFLEGGRPSPPLIFGGMRALASHILASLIIGWGSEGPLPSIGWGSERPLPSIGWGSEGPLPSIGWGSEGPLPSIGWGSESPLPSIGRGSERPLPSIGWGSEGPLPSRNFPSPAQFVNFPLPRPLWGIRDQTGPHGIRQNILPSLGVMFVLPQLTIPEIRLPDRLFVRTRPFP